MERTVTEKPWPAVAVTGADVILNAVGVAGDTVACRRSEPVDAEIPEACAATLALSALYRTMSSCVPPPLVATPLVNVMVVGVPKAVSVPVLSVTVGLVAGSEEGFAPEKVIALSPV